MPRLTPADLEKIALQVREAQTLRPGGPTVRIVVHMGTCGIASGADSVLATVKELVGTSGRDDIIVSTSGCMGLCSQEPLVTVERLGEEPIKYCFVDSEKMKKIFSEHVLGGKVVTEWALARGWEQDPALPQAVAQSTPPGAESLPHIREHPFFASQMLIAMRNRGLMEPDSIEEYIARDGYKALAKALTEMTPEQIIEEVKISGLRGRGGGGFPTGIKWEFCYKAQGELKYVLCNADEGDPGAFMDRSILEGDPHAVLEGMAIAAYAIGSNKGYIYCRAEYPLAVRRLNTAIAKAKDYGLLGENILGTGFSFDLEVYQGAGAFVCGEETALMRSIEGKRGMPRPRPPFPAHKGLYDKPTVLNNVETWANVPYIILHGGAHYASVGTEGSKGTKVFALTGQVKNIGLVEVPMGTSLRKIIFEIGGGMSSKHRKFKAVQLGGPSGGCVPEEFLDLPVDYESIVKAGAIMGSGGMIVMDERTCMVDMARFFMDFVQDESCGKCTPCREGTRRMLEILEKICAGKGTPEDLTTLEALAHTIRDSALCGLGQTGPNPVLSTLRYFRDEYEAHIYEKRCPAKVCVELIEFKVDPDKCKSCGLCARNCPVDAIEWEKKKPAVIHRDKCIRCKTCIDNCKFDAIY